MSNDCSIKATLKVAPAHSDAAASAVDRFVDKKHIAEQNVQELHFEGETLSFYIDMYGVGGTFDGCIQSLADQLSALVTEPGVIEFVDHDAPNDSDAALTCYWVAADEAGKRQARVRYGINQMREWVHADDFADGALDNYVRALQTSIKDAPQPDVPQFDFLLQAYGVDTLLSAATDALPMVFGPVRERLEAALREFETNTALTTWGVEDLGSEDNSKYQVMSKAERRDALQRLAKHYESTESDWMHLENAADEVCKSRQPGLHHLKVTLPDGTVRYAPLERVEDAMDEEGCDLDEAINIALDLGKDVNHLEVDTTHHYDAEGNAID